MKFLIDHNLSPTIVLQLKDRYPGSAHTSELGFDGTADHALWHYARDNGSSNLTKDADFEQLSLLRGAPPKVIWLRIGNCTTRQVMQLLDRHHMDLEEFERDAELSLLALWPK